MSLFAFGVAMLNDQYVNIIPLAQAVYNHNEKLPFHAYLKFGGNADTYFRYCNQSQVPGLQFEFTNSIIENTAEELFWNDSQENSNDIIADYLQRLFRFMFSTGLVKAIQFYIMGQYEHINDEMFIQCSCDELKTKLNNYHIYECGDNVFLKIYP